MSQRDDEPKTYSTERVRQGTIVLNTPLRKIFFFGGLALFVVVAILFGAPHYR